MASSADFDELRRKHPTLGFAVYGIEPDGPVTMEIYTFGEVATFVAPTLTACIVKAFPQKPSANVLLPPPPAPAVPPAEMPGIPEFLRRPSKKKAPAPAPVAADLSVFD